MPKAKSNKKEVSIWQFALNELIEQEFDFETKNWIKSRPFFADVPQQVYEDAVKTWRKHLHEESWDRLAEDEKPRFFEFRHALHLLGYPDEYKFSTLNTCYKDGKKLSENGDFQTVFENLQFWLVKEESKWRFCNLHKLLQIKRNKN